MPEWISARKGECENILQRLLSAPPSAFDESLESKLPTRQGIYAISRKNAPPGQYLHVGRTKTAGLHGRILRQHLRGGGKGAESDLLQKVQDQRFATDRDGAGRWIREKCLVQWVVEEDAGLRTWAEHYVLSVLRPIWGR
jgi:hypothetical protein